mmetsp:Transcript_122495/g.212373  ORF Transcript_122495/g.212373 Transcript_122495/m.212373 type:complete len:755 (-) Transcript_122495:51-2315(-)
MDFSSFADENFDAIAWINNAIKSSKVDGIESMVSSMIMKLQLLSQEVSSSFEETSSQALVRMPRALMEIERMAKEAKNLRHNLNTLLQGDQSEAHSQTQTSVERMNQLHQVRLKLDVCTETIAKVAYLQSNMMRMSMVFEDGDTSTIGSEIKHMQDALQKLTDYPEQHSKFSSTIAGYESQLVHLVEKDCLDALVQHEVSKAQEYLATLSKIGKMEAVVRQFIQRSITKVLDVWQSYETETDFAAWLPLFFNEIKTFVAKEKAYYIEVFGTVQYPSKVASLILCIMDSLDPSFASRIAGMPLPDLVKAYSATSVLYSFCCKELAGQADASGPAIAGLTDEMKTVIYEPYLPQQKQFDQLEKKYLSDSIRKFPWVDRAGDQTQSLTPALVQAIAESSSQMYVLAEEALNRCLEFTDGVESQGLLTVLNEVLVEYAELVGRLVKSVGDDSGLTPKSPLGAALKSPLAPGSPISEANGSPLKAKSLPPRRDASTVKVGLHLHQICAMMLSKLDKFETVAKSIILSKRQVMLNGSSPLLLANPMKLMSLSHFLDSLDSLKIPIFSLATKHFQLLSKDVEALVFDALFEQIRSWLNGIPKMPVWTGTSSEPAEHPLEYIRSIGDYLFDLPMLILSQAPGATAGAPAEEGDDGAQSRYWVDIVVRGCVDLLLQCIEQIPRLSASGGEQLACDVDYFKDVLTMLTEHPYPVLEDLQKLLHCDVTDLATQLGTVQCAEKMPLYKAIRAKRSPSNLQPAGSAK